MVIPVRHIPAPLRLEPAVQSRYTPKAEGTALRLWRAHGLGNDYLVLEEGGPLDSFLVREICNRNRGMGSDGILEPMPTDHAAVGVRIWNPDGSVAEKSGNGLRIFARWWVDRRGGPPTFAIDTGFDVVEAEVSAASIAIAMGTATFDPRWVPVQAPGPVIDAPWTVSDVTLCVTAVGMGNPHIVSFFDDVELDTLPWRRWGEALEVEPRFPNRTNVQFATIRGAVLEIRIWERGAGATLASGSSACAAAAAAVETGRLPSGRVTVRMPGGDLFVHVAQDRRIRLEGPVEAVGEMVVDSRWLASRQASRVESSSGR